LTTSGTAADEAAAPGIARICDRVIYTQIMIKGLTEKGLLTVDPEVWNEAVVVTTTNVDQPVKAYTAEVGAPLPTDLTAPDPAVWRTPHQDLADS
jgi:hypothetical protein